MMGVWSQRWEGVQCARAESLNSGACVGNSYLKKTHVVFVAALFINGARALRTPFRPCRRTTTIAIAIAIAIVPNPPTIAATSFS